MIDLDEAAPRVAKKGIALTIPRVLESRTLTNCTIIIVIICCCGNKVSLYSIPILASNRGTSATTLEYVSIGLICR